MGRSRIIAGASRHIGTRMPPDSSFFSSTCRTRNCTPGSACQASQPPTAASSGKPSSAAPNQARPRRHASSSAVAPKPASVPIHALRLSDQ